MAKRPINANDARQPRQINGQATPARILESPPPPARAGATGARGMNVGLRLRQKYD